MRRSPLAAGWAAAFDECIAASRLFIPNQIVLHLLDRGSKSYEHILYVFATSQSIGLEKRNCHAAHTDQAPARLDDTRIRICAVQRHAAQGEAVQRQVAQGEAVQRQVAQGEAAQGEAAQRHAAQ